MEFSKSTIFCVLIFWCFDVASSNEPTSKRPNIIFALADDLGWNGVGYNEGDAYTPNLDKMAQSSGTVRLLRHYSGSPVCSPTRGTVLTGRNHNRYCIWGVNRYSPNKGDFGKVQRGPLPQSEVSVAEVLKKIGYSTACFGKWHLGNFKNVKGQKTKVSHPGLHGFDQWWATEASTPTSYPNCGCFANMSHINKYCRKGCSNYHSNDSSGNITSWPNPILGEDALFIWELAEKFIREQVKLLKSFFLYLPFHNIHAPFVTTPKYSSQYCLNSTKKAVCKRSNYFGSISALDDAIGRLRHLLIELNVSNNTMFWFTSDNGAITNNTGKLRGRKGTFYEGGIRVPGLIEWPAVIHENRKSTFPVVTSDFLPTVYDILEAEPTDDRPLDGISLVPFLKGKSHQRNQSIIWGKASVKQCKKNKWRTIAISSNPYKLIAHYDCKSRNNSLTNYKLFNLNRDQGETTDLTKHSNDTLHESIAQEFLTKIKKWQQSVAESIKKNCK